MDLSGLYLLGGLCLLLAVVLPQVLHRFAVSAPMVLVGVGLLIGLTPLPDVLGVDQEPTATLVLHLTELTILVALMGVGLALDRPLDLRSWRSIRGWWATWRLLVVAMPLTIAAVAVLGWWVAGLAPAAALLLGAILAPTDPVLAADVQVAGPSVAGGYTSELAADQELSEDPAEAGAPASPSPAESPHEEHDEVRFALTAEAGLNDGLAFPFVHLALLVAAAGSFAVTDAASWVGWHLVGKVAIGVAIGYVVGRAFGYLAFDTGAGGRLAEIGEPLLALAGLLVAYGGAELAHGYGFLAVFACALTLRAAEREHDYHRDMHALVERLERLLTLVILLALGIATTRGLLEHLDWRGVTVGVALVLVIRPAVAWVSLLRPPRTGDETGALRPGERVATAFFGVRGVGSLFYLAYAATHSEVPLDSWLVSTVAFTIVLSVLVHGVLAKPVLARLERPVT